MALAQKGGFLNEKGCFLGRAEKGQSLGRLKAGELVCRALGRAFPGSEGAKGCQGGFCVRWLSLFRMLRSHHPSPLATPFKLPARKEA